MRNLFQIQTSAHTRYDTLFYVDSSSLLLEAQHRLTVGVLTLFCSDISMYGVPQGITGMRHLLLKVGTLGVNEKLHSWCHNQGMWRNGDSQNMVYVYICVRTCICMPVCESKMLNVIVNQLIMRGDSVRFAAYLCAISPH